jgi:glycosyltransferase involved in cell wall biosynthesis
MYKDTIEISVIVPVYNVEKYVSACIESILKSTFTDFELLLVNDGSTDNSGVICDIYAQKNACIKVFHQKNGGVTAARRKGLEHAIGKYIYFVDADDTIPETALKDLYIAITGYDMAIGQLNFIYPRGKSKVIGIDEKRCYDRIEYLKALLSMDVWIGPVARLISRQLFDEHTLDIARDIVSGEDLIMNCRVGVKINACIFLNKVVYEVNRIREDSVMATFRQSLEFAKEMMYLALQPISNAGYAGICKNEIIWFKAIVILSILNLQYSINKKDSVIIELRQEVKQLKWTIKNSRIKLYFVLLRTPFLCKPVIKFIRWMQKAVHNFLRFIGKKNYGIS